MDSTRLLVHDIFTEAQREISAPLWHRLHACMLDVHDYNDKQAIVINKAMHHAVLEYKVDFEKLKLHEII